MVLFLFEVFPEKRHILFFLHLFTVIQAINLPTPPIAWWNNSVKFLFALIFVSLLNIRGVNWWVSWKDYSNGLETDLRLSLVERHISLSRGLFYMYMYVYTVLHVSCMYLVKSGSLMIIIIKLYLFSANTNIK